MRFDWQSITDEDAVRLATKHHLKPFEVKIMNLRRKGVLVEFVAHEINYSVRQTINHSNRLRN